MQHKYLLAGGSGFLGQALGRRLRARGHEVVVLTRSRPRQRDDGIREVPWQPADAALKSNPMGYFAEEAWVRELAGATGIVNLAGSPINQSPTAAHRRDILQSRLDAVCALGRAWAACPRPPAVWVQASAVGYYGDAGERRCDETAPAGAGPLAEICGRWEGAFAAACPAAVRPVVLRLGVVLGCQGGAFPPLARAARWLAGGAAGSGRQGLSWIHQTDVEEIFLRAVEDAEIRGVYNAVAPEPASNADFMRRLRQALRRPWSPPVPALLLRPLLRWVVRTDPALVLEGQFAVPARLEAAGYRFRFGRLPPALADLVGRG